MNIAIDALNIRAGGGVTHLRELLNNSNPKLFGFDKVVVFSGTETLKQINNQDWLVKISSPMLDKSLFFILIWRLLYFNKYIKQNNISLLLSPSGTYTGKFRPYVTMSQNMLIFDKKEVARFGFSVLRLKFVLLNYFQTKSFRNASGIIFLSKYAKNTICNLINIEESFNKIIAHGIDDRFRKEPKIQREISTYTSEQPYKLLYVSTINVYKHQWNIIAAIAKLKQNGYNIELILIGSIASKQMGKKFNHFLEKYDSRKMFIKYLGQVNFDVIETYYKNSDGFIFASTCENFPNILIEAMSCGLPILSSNYDPMPEIYTEQGFYFDPLSIEDIICKLKIFLDKKDLREQLSFLSYNLSQKYNWQKTSESTLKFLEDIVKKEN